MRLFATLLAATLLTSPAMAQLDSREAISLQDQIAELRQELQIMQQNQQNAGQAPYAPPQSQAAAPGSGGSDAVAELTVRVSALEEQNRTLQGRIDDLTNQLQHQNDALTKQIGDLAFKISQGAAAAPTAQGDAGTQATPQADQPEPAAPPPPPNKHRPAEVALREGNAAIARRDYPAAAEAAHEVLANGHGTHLAEASLLLARAEGGLHQYHQAAADYFQAFKHAPQAPGAPVALLGMAFSFIGEHKNADACQALALLNKQFPHPPAVIKANAAAAHRGAGCK